MQRLFTLAGLCASLLPNLALANPTVSAIADQTADVGTIPEYTFTVTGATGALTLTASSSNTTILPNASLSTPPLVGTDGKVVVTVGNPVSVSDPIFSTITVTATDTNGPSSRNFKLTINRRPTLTSMSDVTGATEDTAKNITFSTLNGGSDLADPDSADTVGFKLDSIVSGTMSVAVGASLTSGSWTWTPPANQNGRLEAFKVKGWDGRIASSTAISVFVNVAKQNNDAPILTGDAIGITGATPPKIPDNAPIKLFPDLVVSDPDFDYPGDSNPVESVTVRVTSADLSKGNFLLENGWTAAGTGVFAFGPTTPAIAQDKLRNVRFSPTANLVAVGQMVTTNVSVTVEDSLGNPTASTNPDRSWTINIESINDIPELVPTFFPTSIPDSAAVKPFRLVINDPDVNENFTVTLQEVVAPGGTAAGTLTPASFSAAGVTGTKSAVQTAIQTQATYTPNPAGAVRIVKFKYTITDGHLSTPESKEGDLTITFNNDPTDISGITTVIIHTTDDPSAAPVYPFQNVLISDSDPGQLLKVTLSFDDPDKGSFEQPVPPASTAVASLNNGGVALSAEAWTTWLRSLRFVPKTGRLAEGLFETVNLRITVKDGASPELVQTNSSTNIVVTYVNGSPALFFNNSLVFPGLASPISIPPPPLATPFTDVKIKDVGLLTVTVSLDVKEKGTLTNLGDFTELPPAGSHRYQLTNKTDTAATAAIKLLNFVPNPAYLFPANNPGRTNFTIAVTDDVNNFTQRILPIYFENQSRTWLVTNPLDDLTPGTLRHAVAQSGSNDIIAFALPQYPAFIRLKNDPTHGPIDVSHHLNFKGPGADKLTISGDSNSNGQTDAGDTQLFRIFANVTMEGLTLSRGYGTTGGACAVSRNLLAPTDPSDPTGALGSLKLTACAVTDCLAAEWGGALDVYEGSLALDRCLLRGNSLVSGSGQGGGAVSLYTSQPCSFTNTTFSANRQNAPTGYGGGALYVENYDPTVLVNTTVLHCTFDDNVDESGQGSSICANVLNAYVHVANSIFADSVLGGTEGRNLYVLGGGAIISDGCNVSSDTTNTILIQGSNPAQAKLLNQSSDRTATDPKLLPLALGIGGTACHVLQSTSPAINLCGGTQSRDQRGVLRDATPDAGAYENVSTARVLLNEIYATSTAVPYLEFYVPRDSTAFNFQNFEVWVDGTKRHVFAADTVQSGYGILVTDNISLNSNGTEKRTPSVNPLALKTRGIIELRTPGGQVYLRVAYGNVFANSTTPASDLVFTPENSLSLVPQFSGAAYLPSSLAIAPPLEGINNASLNLANSNGPGSATSPGRDNANTNFGQPNSNPLAVTDDFLVPEDDFPSFNVLSNDLDADGLDLLYITDVSTLATPGNRSVATSLLGVPVTLDPVASPLRATSIKYDPRTVLTHLSAGAHAFDSFYYTIADIGAGAIISYAADGPGTKIGSLGNRLIVGTEIKITGSGIPAYNQVFTITARDLDSFTIPVAFAGVPTAGNLGSWSTTGTRSPTTPSQQIVTVTVLGANDPPTPTPNTVATTEEQILRIFGDTDLTASSTSFDTDVNYPLPRAFSPVAVLADDTDPDDDDSVAATGTYKHLKLVGVCQAAPITNYESHLDGSVTKVTAANHGLSTGTTVLISGYGGHPSYNGYQEATVLDANTFTIAVPFIDNASPKGLWTILNNENRLSTRSLRDAEVRLEIRANRAQTNIVYNPRTSSYMNGLAKDEIDNTDSFYYAVEDSHAAISLAKISVTVTGVNDSPVPGNDPPSLAGLLDLPGFTNPASVLGAGQVQYQLPATGGNGKKDATFTYNGTTVILRDLCATNEDTALPVSSALLLSNDSDVDKTHSAFADVLHVQLRAGQFISREGAAVSISGDGLTVTYDPRGIQRLQALAREEMVIDTFNITIFDGTIGIPSVVAVLVTGVNDTPIASPDSATIPEDQLLTLGPPGVLLNDTDIDQNTRLPDNKKMLLPVSNQGTTVFGTDVDASIAQQSGPITQFSAVPGNPALTLVNVPAHGLQSGEEIVISDAGYAAFNGQFPILLVNAGSFSIPVAFDAAGAALSSGSWKSVRSTLTYDPRGSVFSFVGPSPNHTPAFTLDGLAQGQTYTDSYTYTMMDGSMVFANNDLYRIEVDRSSIELKVLTNDVNLNSVGVALKIISVGTPNHGGAVTLNGTTSLIYTPATSFVGDEVFIYTVEDELGNRDSALVTARVTIMQLNGNLQANADTFTVAKGQSPLLNVLANDDLIPATGATLSITNVSVPNHGGTAVRDGNGIRYTPTGSGTPYTETFTYEISAGGSAKATAQVVVLVEDRTNTLPMRDDSFSVPAGTLDNVLNVLANDNILPGNGNALIITAVTVPTQGTVSIVSDGSALLFSPPVGFVGSTSFNYTAQDGLGGTNTAHVSVEVGYLATNPDFFTVLYDDPAKSTDDGPTVLDVLSNDIVLQGPSATLRIVSVTSPGPSLGVMSINGPGTMLSFNPMVSAVGQQNFTYVIQDTASGHQANGSLTIVIAQQGLRANADYFTVQTDSTGNEMMVLANDVLFKPGGGTMTITGIGTGPNAPDQGGTVTVSPTGDRLIYAAVPGFDGVESFTYIVTDGLVTDTARVVIRSTTGELAAGPDFYTVFRGSSDNLLPVLGNDLVIPDGGQVLTITALTNDPANIANPVNRGQLVIGSDLRSLIYTPNPLNTSSPEYIETFTYEISDGTARRDQALLSIRVQDRIGARNIDTNDDSFTVMTGSAEVTLNVLANDNIKPATASGWTITSVSTPTSNVCSPFIAADLLDQTALVQKLVNHTDPVSLFLWNGFSAGTKTLLANVGADATLKQNALIQELNTVVGGALIYTAPRFTGITLRAQTTDLLAANATGEQLIVLNRLLLEDAYPIELRQSPGGGIVATSGDVLLYTPLPGFTGVERFTYKVSDGFGGTGSGEVTVRVGDVSVSDDEFALLSDSSNNELDVMANDGILRDAYPAPPVPSAADFTLATNRAIVLFPPSSGTAWVAGGKVRFTPTAGFFGIVTLTYWAADDSGCYFPGVATVDVQKRGSDRHAALLTITVTGVNDPPVMLGSVVTPISDKQITHPFAGVTIRDVDNQLNELITVRISFPAAHGVLEGPFNLVSPGLYEYIGNGGQATEAIRALVYRPVENRITAELTEPTIFTVSLQDPFLTVPVTDANTTVNVMAVNDPPVITGTIAGQHVYEQSSIEPFGGVNITDVDNLTVQPLTVTVVIDNVIKGNLTNLGGFVQSPAGTYTKTGTAAQVSDALRGLVFNSTPGNRVTPGNPETSTFTISVNDGFAPAVINSQTTVIVQDPFAKKLLPTTTGNADASQLAARFGSDVDISGNTLVVGSPARDVTLADSGAAYVYERNVGGSGAWGQVIRLAPADLLAGDLFGDAVVVDGDLMAVSAPAQDAGGIVDSGAVYVFKRDALNAQLWNQVIKLRAPVGDRVAGDGFGKALALKGTTLVVGSPNANKPGNDSGAVFVYEKDLGGVDLWGFKERLLPVAGPIDGITLDNFGSTLALDGNTLAIGAIGANRALTAGNLHFGAVYVFDRPNPAGAFTQSRKIQNFSDPTASEDDWFGCGLDISGNTIVVGACQMDQGAVIHTGAAFVYERNLTGAGNWGLSKRLSAPTLFEGDLFGRSVGIDGNIILVGASKQLNGINPVSNSGFVRAFRRELGGAENWGVLDQFQPGLPTAIDQYGLSTAIDHFTAAVGAFTDSVNPSNAVQGGAAYVYDFKFNNFPTLIQNIADQVAPENVLFTFAIPPATFNDADYADVFTYSAKLDDGTPIPPASWLQFNPATATFSGTPTPTNYHPLHLILTATDQSGASVASNVFTISVAVDPTRQLAILIEEWRQDHFPSGSLLNPSLESILWGSNANPDGDAYSNLIEMMMGTDPNVPNGPGLLGVEANPPLITLLYQLDESFPTEFVHVQWSLDLTNWNEINVSETVRADLGSVRTIAASAFPPTPVGRIYMRVKVAP